MEKPRTLEDRSALPGSQSLNMVEANEWKSRGPWETGPRYPASRYHLKIHVTLDPFARLRLPREEPPIKG
jgi:hypothetical protein